MEALALAQRVVARSSSISARERVADDVTHELHGNRQRDAVLEQGAERAAEADGEIEPQNGADQRQMEEK